MDRLIRNIRSLSLKEKPDIRLDIFELPTEVCLIIYRHLLVSGDRAIFSTSKFVRNEGLPPFFQLHTGYSYSTFETPPFSCATDGIQNLRLKIFMHGKSPVDCGLIKYFGGSQIKRECCEVILDLGRQQPFYFLDRFADPVIFLALSSLTGFKRLYVKIINQGGLAGGWRQHNSGCETVRPWLEGALGPAILHDNNANRYLEFHPYHFSHRDEGSADEQGREG